MPPLLASVPATFSVPFVDASVPEFVPPVHVVVPAPTVSELPAAMVRPEKEEVPEALAVPVMLPVPVMVAPDKVRVPVRVPLFVIAPISVPPLTVAPEFIERVPVPPCCRVPLLVSAPATIRVPPVVDLSVPELVLTVDDGPISSLSPLATFTEKPLPTVMLFICSVPATLSFVAGFKPLVIDTVQASAVVHVELNSVVVQLAFVFQFALVPPDHVYVNGDAASGRLGEVSTMATRQPTRVHLRTVGFRSTVTFTTALVYVRKNTP